jgi:hypothetical protein
VQYPYIATPEGRVQYVTQEKDNWGQWGIAEGDVVRWKQLVAANAVLKNPNRIYPTVTVLNVPDTKEWNDWLDQKFASVAPEGPSDDKSGPKPWLPIALAVGAVAVGGGAIKLRKDHEKQSPFTSPPVLPEGIASLDHAGVYVATMYQSWRQSLPADQEGGLPRSIALTGRRVDISGPCRVRNSETGEWEEKNLSPAVCVYEFTDGRGNALYAVERCGNPLRSQTGGFSPLPATQVRPCVHHTGADQETVSITAWPIPTPNPAPAPTAATPAPDPSVEERTHAPALVAEPTAPRTITIERGEGNQITVTTPTGKATILSSDAVVIDPNGGTVTVTIGSMVFMTAPATPTA